MILKAPLAVALQTRECGIRSRLADKALQELPEISDRGTPAPKAPTLPQICLKMSTNCTAWLRSIMDCEVISETPTKRPTFTSIVQIAACEIGSSPSRPKRA